MRNRAVRQVTETAGTLLLKQVYHREVTGISDEISPDDTMFEGVHEHYHSVGQSAFRCVKLGMLAAGKHEFRNILDFACGFGRVLRVLRAAFPAADITACDMSKEGVHFCASAFDAKPVVSSENLDQIPLKGQFDLIWCGSLLTHLDGPEWGRFIRFFQSQLAPDGVLIFTTHGPFVEQRMRTEVSNYGLGPEEVEKVLTGYERQGIGYGDYPHHIPPLVGVTKYGISVSRPSWVCRQVEDVRQLRILSYCERGWDNHQDTVTCFNPSELQ